MAYLTPWKLSNFLKETSFENRFNNSVNSTLIQSDGKILVGGIFTNYSASNRNRLIRLNADGTLDSEFTNNASGGNRIIGSVNAIAVQSNGKILIGGGYVAHSGVSGRNYFVRLNSDGTTDTSFCTNATDGSKFSANVTSIIIQSDEKILIGGSFINYAGITGRSRLVRLNSDGTLDTAFCANAADGSKFSSNVNSISIQSDGKILVSGNFVSYAGTAGRNRLIRLNSDGTLDTAFCVNATDGDRFNNVVFSIATQPDGKILVGGIFTNYAGTTGRSYLVRLNSDGSIDTSFCTNATDGSKFNASIDSIVIQSEGKVLIGGSFTNYAGTSGRGRFILLNSDGTLDTQFTSNAADGSRFSSGLRTIALQSDGKILVGGSFTSSALTVSNRMSSYFKQILINGASR